jgi:hypothetical protein
MAASLLKGPSLEIVHHGKKATVDGQRSLGWESKQE